MQKSKKIPFVYMSAAAHGWLPFTCQQLNLYILVSCIGCFIFELNWAFKQFIYASLQMSTVFSVKIFKLIIYKDSIVYIQR